MTQSVIVRVPSPSIVAGGGAVPRASYHTHNFTLTIQYLYTPTTVDTNTRNSSIAHNHYLYSIII